MGSYQELLVQFKTKEEEAEWISRRLTPLGKKLLAQIKMLKTKKYPKFLDRSPGEPISGMNRNEILLRSYILLAVHTLPYTSKELGGFSDCGVCKGEEPIPQDDQMAIESLYRMSPELRGIDRSDVYKTD